MLDDEAIAVPSGRGEFIPTLNIVVNFEFDKDKSLQNNFYRQAKEETNHRIRDCSLHEIYPDEVWKNKARNAIRQCDVVVFLVGQNTQRSRGHSRNGHSPQLWEAYHPGASPGQAV